MAFPKEKREFLVGIMGEDKTAELEADLGTRAKAAADEEMEFKAEAAEKAEAEAKAAEKVKAKAAEKAKETGEETPEGDPPEEPQYVTREELIEEVGGLFAEYGERISTLQTAVEALGKSLKEFERSEEDRIAEKAAETPAASMGELLRNRAVGSTETRVDGRTKDALKGPKETSPLAAGGRTPSSFLNTLMAASQGQPAQ